MRGGVSVDKRILRGRQEPELDYFPQQGPVGWTIKKTARKERRRAWWFAGREHLDPRNAPTVSLAEVLEGAR
jgi:hypothetical protein